MSLKNTKAERNMMEDGNGRAGSGIAGSDTAFSVDKLPEEFLADMKKLLPGEEYAAFLSSYGQERLFSLRVNPLKCSREVFLQCFSLPEGPGENASGEKNSGEENSEGETSGEEKSEGEISGEENSEGEYSEGAKSSRGVNVGLSCGLGPVPWEPDGFYYPEDLRPGKLPWHEAGMYYIQEASAMAPAVLVGAKPGERVLDLCAAPGGKSTKLAACLQGQGILVANEIHPERAKILSANLERMGVRNAVVTNETPRRLASRFPLYFDRIAVDAPCSGEGMFRKEEQALIHWSPENVRMCAQRQLEILEEAAAMLKKGGTLVYSTCTFSREENEDVIAHFLAEHPEFEAVDVRTLMDADLKSRGFEYGRIACGDQDDPDRPGRTECFFGAVRLWPHRIQGEGHFAAVMKKKAADFRGGSESGAAKAFDPGKQEAAAGRSGAPLFAGEAAAEKRKKNKKSRKGAALAGGNKGGCRDPKREQALQLWREFREEALKLSGDSFPEENIILFGETLYLLPFPAGSLPIDGLRVLRPGLALGDVKKGRFMPAHALAMALKREEAAQSISLSGTSPEAYAWIRGEAVRVCRTAPEGCADRGGDSVLKKGWILVMIDGCGIGWGKIAENPSADGMFMVKNHYPKGLRRANWQAGSSVFCSAIDHIIPF